MLHLYKRKIKWLRSRNERRIMRKHTFRRCTAAFAAFTVMATAASFGTASVTAADGSRVWGDANCDGVVDMSDCVLVMQALANPNKYGLNGSDSNHIKEQGIANADVFENGTQLTSSDALSIQKYLLHTISTLPESYMQGNTNPVIDTTTSTTTTTTTT
ncbi:MAG: dockerin type I repeat-containing protein, partial [Ruminococcus sp.]|nr:dockerin type I repeat-containing protein [Ruminococcus sp.]